MNKENLILCNELCVHYQIEMSFFSDLNAFGIIEVVTVEGADFIHEEHVNRIEKVLRMQNDLNLNLEGIDVALNLLDRIDQLENELTEIKNRLRLYEDE